MLKLAPAVDAPAKVLSHLLVRAPAPIVLLDYHRIQQGRLVERVDWVRYTILRKCVYSSSRSGFEVPADEAVTTHFEMIISLLVLLNKVCLVTAATC